MQGEAITGERVPVRAGRYVAVDLHAERQVEVGADGLVFTAACAPLPE